LVRDNDRSRLAHHAPAHHSRRRAALAHHAAAHHAGRGTALPAAHHARRRPLPSGLGRRIVPLLGPGHDGDQPDNTGNHGHAAANPGDNQCCCRGLFLAFASHGALVFFVLIIVHVSLLASPPPGAFLARIIVAAASRRRGGFARLRLHTLLSVFFFIRH